MRKGEKLSRIKRREKLGGKGNGRWGEGHRKREEMSVMRMRDHWKINHVCQGNRLVAIKPPSAAWRESKETGDKAEEEGGRTASSFSLLKYLLVCLTKSEMG